MIVDTIEDARGTLNYVRGRKTLLVPIFCSPTQHVAVNTLCAVYIYTEDDVERIIPFRHSEQLRGFTELVPEFLALENIFVHDKKQWLQTGGNAAVWDVKTLWWYTYSEAYDESHYPTAAHRFYWRRHTNLPAVNSIVPLQQHLAMCQKIRHYDYHTVTGRPSNAFGGFNFAAMNKEDGTRAAFCSRFEQGALVEMDFDSYHVRLIATAIGYELPASSIHDYLGRFYFDTDALTEEQRAESKAITFRLLYGGIDSEFLSIPFFRKVIDFVYTLWDKWKRAGCIYTPITKRSICKDAVQNMTAFKLFNYYLQAIETEVSVRKLQQVQDLLRDYESCIVLYTYDSVLFDMKYSEARDLLPAIKNMLEQGNLPVKCKVGDIYDKMKTISL